MILNKHAAFTWLLILKPTFLSFPGENRSAMPSPWLSIAEEKSSQTIGPVAWKAIKMAKDSTTMSHLRWVVQRDGLKRSEVCKKSLVLWFILPRMRVDITPHIGMYASMTMKCFIVRATLIWLKLVHRVPKWLCRATPKGIAVKLNRKEKIQTRQSQMKKSQLPQKKHVVFWQ